MPVTTFVDEGQDSVRRQIDINLVGVITAPSWRSSGSSPRRRLHRQYRSQAGKPGSGDRHLLATKHAVVGLSEAVRAELRGSGVEVLCVMPTIVNTELTSGVGQKWVKPVEARTSRTRFVRDGSARFDSSCQGQRGALQIPAAAAARRPRGPRRAMKVDKLMLEVDHGARRLRGARRGQRAERRSGGERDAGSAARRGLKIGRRVEPFRRGSA